MTPAEKEPFWSDHFTAWQANGLSQVDYCKQYDLKFANFSYWRTRQNKSRRKLLPLSSPAISSSSVVLNLPMSIRLELGAELLADVLTGVIRALRQD